MKLVTAFLDLDYWISLDEAAEFLGVDIPARHRVLQRLAEGMSHVIE